MKIAILAHMFLPAIGGAEVYAYNIARELRAIGNRVDIYIPAGNYNSLHSGFRENIIPLPQKFFGLLHNIPIVGMPLVHRYLNQMQNKEHYDVWVAVGTYPSGYALTALQGKVTTVLASSGADIQVNPELEYGARLHQKIGDRIVGSVKCHDKIIVTAETVRSDFLELGISDERVITIPRGVDLEWFRREHDTSGLRSELGWPEYRAVILTTGRNHPKKGFNLIPQIASILRNDGLDFRWYVVGKGTNELECEIKGRGLEDYLITRDAVGLKDSTEGEWRFPNDALVKMYQAADIYAFPSLLESFGIVQIEAMAAGTPIVSTDAPGCREVVVHELSGLQAKAGDAESFARCLSQLIRSPEYRNRLSKSASEFVKRFDWPSIAGEHQALFEELTSDKEIHSFARGV